MKKILTVLLVVLAAGCENPSSELKEPLPEKSAGTFRIAFGSCDNQNEPQTIWSAIENSKPDLWIWLGDNIYADTDNMTKMKTMYELQKSFEVYNRFRKQVPIIGTWDDHDLGYDNAGKEYPQKKASMQLCLDFLGEPADSPRRKQNGVYATYELKKEGVPVRIILLDTRYNRDRPGPNSDMLGEEQWSWFENIIETDTSALCIIGSSNQVFPFEHWREKWARFPKSKKQLMRLLKDHTDKKFLFISGDRHYGDISKIDGVMPAPLYEVTSSGLTHYKGLAWFYAGLEKNNYRVSKPWIGLNFGVIDIDMTMKPVRVSMYICDKEGFVRIKARD
ncbi:alkaline phosphatase family protein [bacterium]|nr:alkaline phosphatase family protein [bacterium]